MRNRRLIRWLGSLAPIMLLLGSCAADDGEVALAGRPDEALPVLVDVDVPYTPQFALDVYYPDASGPWPVAVVFHGGEVVKSSVHDYASAVAEQGVVVFVPEYTSSPAQLTEDLHLGGNDAVCAMRFARANASDFNGAGDRIVTAGASYGANVAALMMFGSDEFDGDCLVDSEVSAVADGLLGLDGMYDFATLPEVLGFHGLYTMEEMQRASAIAYVEPAEPDDDTAIELFTGRQSATQDQAAWFSERLAAAGYEVSVVPLPSLPHNAFANAPGTTEALADMAFSSERSNDGEAAAGTVTVEVSDIEGYAGSQLAGVLLSGTAQGGTGVAGFAVTVDSDPFSSVQVLGNVSEDWSNSGPWPWATGVASIPAGTYTLRVVLGTDYCCYSRWVPAEAPNLRLCDVTVTTTGDDQAMEIGEIVERGRCGLGSEPGVCAECLADMEDAARVPSLKEELSEHNQELHPTFTSCTSVEEWEAAAGVVGLGDLLGADFIEGECAFNPGVYGTPLCAAVAELQD